MLGVDFGCFFFPNSHQFILIIIFFIFGALHVEVSLFFFGVGSDSEFLVAIPSLTFKLVFGAALITKFWFPVVEKMIIIVVLLLFVDFRVLIGSNVTFHNFIIILVGLFVGGDAVVRCGILHDATVHDASLTISTVFVDAES